jgi:hypothetical protein
MHRSEQGCTAHFIIKHLRSVCRNVFYVLFLTGVKPLSLRMKNVIKIRLQIMYSYLCANYEGYKAAADIVVVFLW